MNTPIYDFVTSYVDRTPVRFHMPGHKGNPFLGCEARDITEIPGADILSAPEGVILESENNATVLFGTAHTFYSTEGSSQCIRAMLSIVASNAPKDRRRYVLAARNVHKAMIYACALLDLEVEWLYPKQFTSLCACPITAEEMRAFLEASKTLPLAVYLTSPDYLGNLADLPAIADVCHRFGVPLLVDNAHGAYLRFLPQSLHPIDLGADLCCDSAHKTLPVLTGGAYLHISKHAPKEYLKAARPHLALYSSTSPSYLILQSLDLCNHRLATDFPRQLCRTVEQTATFKQELQSLGYRTTADEPLKICIDTAAYGYTGSEFSEILRSHGMEVEYADATSVVLMPSTETSESDWSQLRTACHTIVQRPPIEKRPQRLPHPTRVCSLREAMLAPTTEIPTEESEGRICATPTVSCPPAIPIVISGERITAEHIALFCAYGMKTVCVLKDTTEHL